MKDVIDEIESVPISLLVTSSSPTGPSDESAGKDRIARRMSASVTCRDLCRLSSGRRLLYAVYRGCLSWRYDRVSAEFGAGLSSEVSILITALMLPPSIFEEIVAAITLASSAVCIALFSANEEFGCVFVAFISVQPAPDDGRQLVSYSFSTRWLAVAFADDQESHLLLFVIQVLVTSSEVFLSLRPQAERTDLGMCLMNFDPIDG